MDSMRYEQITTVAAIAVNVLLVAVMAVYVWRSTRPGARPRATFLEVYIEASILLGAFLFAFPMLWAASLGTDAAELPSVSAEHSPALMFTEIDADTTPEELPDLAAEYGCAVDDGMAVSMPQSEIQNRVVYYVTPEEGEWAEVLMGDWLGQALVLTFTAEPPQRLITVRLDLRSEAGSAFCLYYPTAFTEYGRAPGYTLITRADGSLLDKTSQPDTAREALDLACAVVYPNGSG